MSNRILAIDILRGMTIVLMIIVNTPGSWSYVYAPFRHAQWHGCTPTDLVFPSFLFTVGLSMFFSWNKLKVDHLQLLRKGLKRALLITLIGILLTWFPFFNLKFDSVRYFNVLQRIGLSFGLASLLLYWFKTFKGRLLTAVILLIFYSIIQMVFGDFSLEGNINKTIDSSLFGESHLYGGFGIPFDPEGILGILSSAAHIIVGFLIASILNQSKRQFPQKGIFIGGGLIGLGFLLSTLIPINKPLWTASYVVWTSGIATVLLAGLVYIIDVKGYKSWSGLFKVFGVNPLFCYILSILIVKLLLLMPIGEGNMYGRTYQSIFRPIFGDYNGSLAFAVFISTLVAMPAYLLYRRKIYIKI